MTSLSRYFVAGFVLLGLVAQVPGCVRVGTGSGALASNRAVPPSSVRTDVADSPRTTTQQPRAERAASERTPAATDGEDEDQDWVERGVASWYGEAHHGKTTASGEPFDMYAMTAAHPSLEMGTRVEVENLSNGRTVIVRINDRGPFTENRVIDLSMAAAQALGFAAAGTAEVEVRPLK